MRILIVDDELVSREKLRKIMADFGECIVVDNGADALKIATSQAPPDLILLDIIMPEMDGYEVCKRLKAKKSTSDIPVIFITTKQDEDDEARGLGLGAVDYIRKPFSPSIVKARVRTHLELKKHRNRLEEIVNGRTVELEKATKEMQVEIAERKQAEEALRKAHDELEWRVKERTGELVKMNEQLKVEIEERKQVEEALQTREKLINALLNNQIDAATVVDKDLKMLYVNEFLADRFGRSVDEMIGLSPEDVVDKADLVTAKRVAYFKQVATTGKPVRFEDKRGGIWFDTVVTPVLDKDGQVFQVAILARDITDKKNIEQALVESEERYRGLVETMAEGLVIQDENSLIIYVNNRFCKMVDYQQDELIGKPIMDLLDERNKQIVKGEIDRRRKGAPAQSYETEIIRKDGHQISVFLSPRDILDSDGQFKGSFAVFTDISSRKQAEAALRESEAKYRELAENAGLGIYQVTKGGKFLMANQRMANIFGYDSQQDFLGNVDSAIKLYVNPEERPSILKDIDEKGHIDGRELNLKRKDGTPIFCNAYIRSIRSKDGEYIYEGLLEDITARKRTAKELRLISSSLLKAQERERKRISLELHDELGQSLLALKLQISFIEKGLEEGQAELRSDCQAMLDQIVELIGHIRRICRDLSPVILDDLGLTAGIRWLVENALKSHDIDTSLDIVNIDKLLTNEQRLLVFRIFQETFTNIVRHSCSSLTSIIIRKQGGEISFVIEDNGKGFDVKEAMGRDLAKRGMGLSSMEERAWMLGGSVNIWSQRELGTRIEFRVPIEQPEKT